MILLCGIPSESPMALVSEALAALGVPTVTLNQRSVHECEIGWSLAGGRLTGELRIGAAVYALERFVGVYTRLMDDQLLPELRDDPAESPRRGHSRAFHDALARWYEISPARVVNRARPQGSNFSKPFQAQLIRQAGFEIPETLITNDPEQVVAFREEHGRVVYKSISGVRSIVRTLEDDDLARLDRIRWCPVQFQQRVEGANVRVHVVGGEVFATGIATEATDYRYARRDELEAELYELTLPDELAERCVGLAAALDLPFAGIDLMLTPGERVYCFEVNPSPAFSYYELHTGQPIAMALARYLAALPSG
jgi:glutathione synthase/RimK-type ligase-like ATP-grasp enzyme